MHFGVGLPHFRRLASTEAIVTVAQQAEALGSLDVLSGGRLIVGAAVGWLAEEFEALGIPFAERGARSDEALRVMRALLTETEPRFEGRFFRFASIKAEPKPLQKPHPPIWIGGSSAAAFRRAAEFGDAWHPSHRPGEEIAAGGEEV